MVRQYLDGKFGRPTEINPYLASMLYAFDRFESKEKINQWLNQGKVVILDRYYTSNFIHQAAKLPEKKMADFISWVEELELKVLKIPKPDLIVYLHVEAEIAYNLIAKRGQGYDGHDTLKHLKEAEKKCLQLSKKLGWLIIECAEKNQIKEIDKIAKIIWQEIKPALD